MQPDQIDISVGALRIRCLTTQSIEAAINASIYAVEIGTAFGLLTVDCMDSSTALN